MDGETAVVFIEDEFYTLALEEEEKNAESEENPESEL